MRNKHSNRPSIEALETRIAPAGVIAFTADGKTATWTDVDGDAVKLVVSKGTLDETLFTIDDSSALGLLVEKVDLTNSTLFSGTKVTVTSTRNPLAGGDGTVNLGFIDATGVSLGAVSVTGDLGRIDAGSTVPTFLPTKALASLKVYSMGALDGATLPSGVQQTSEIFGKVGAITVRGSVKGVLFNVTGDDAGSIDSITIGGSLIGTADGDSGRFATTGKIGIVTIKGSIIGDAGQHSGSIAARGPIASIIVGGSVSGGRSDTPSTDGTGVIRSDASIGSVTIGGSILGGTQQDSGLISTAGDLKSLKVLGAIVGGSAGTSNGGIFVDGNVGTISIKGDVIGGAADDSGLLRIGGKATSIQLLGALVGGAGERSGSLQVGTSVADAVGLLSIGRDLRGSTGEDSGSIRTEGPVKQLIVRGDILGGTAFGTGSIFANAVGQLSISGSVVGGDLDDVASDDLEASALIQIKKASSIIIGGSLVSGSDYSGSNVILNSATIRVEQNVGKLIIKGSVLGTADTQIFITASGQETIFLNTDQDVAFGSIAIGGSVIHSSILAGYGTGTVATESEENPNAQIGTVVVGGDWIASNLLSGARWSDSFGDGLDSKAAGVDSPAITARIKSIAIVGQIIGTASSSTDQFRFMAQAIDTMTVGGSLVSLDIRKGNDNDLLAPRYNLANTLDVRVFEFPDVV